MKRLLLMIMLAGASAAAQTPEELYGEYLTPETRAIMERFEEAERRSQEARAADEALKTLALGLSVLIGLIPLGVIGRRIVREKTWKGNPSGTVKAIGTGIGGGFVLFGLNYGEFLLKLKMGDAFHTSLAFLLVAGLIAGSIYLLKKG